MLRRTGTDAPATAHAEVVTTAGLQFVRQNLGEILWLASRLDGSPAAGAVPG